MDNSKISQSYSPLGHRWNHPLTGKVYKQSAQNPSPAYKSVKLSSSMSLLQKSPNDIKYAKNSKNSKSNQHSKCVLVLHTAVSAIQQNLKNRTKMYNGRDGVIHLQNSQLIFQHHLRVLLNALAQLVCRYMKLLYFAWQVDASEPAHPPQHHAPPCFLCYWYSWDWTICICTASSHAKDIAHGLCCYEFATYSTSWTLQSSHYVFGVMLHYRPLLIESLEVQDGRCLKCK